jgi:putative ABC transport system permease protein
MKTRTGARRARYPGDAMRALNRKLMRDLWRLRGQVMAIALVVASGVALLVMSLGTLDSLRSTSDAYYERYRFADVFAIVKRAPLRIVERIKAIPGVQAVETRITGIALLDIPGFAEPVTGQLVSIPERHAAVLNRLVMRVGRRVEPNRPNEVVLSEPFAEAHGFRPGDTFAAVIQGHKRTLRVVGLALSPEYVYAIGPGALMPDDQRFGVLWMGRDALAAAYDLDGAFNDVSLTLLRGADADGVIEHIDRLRGRYGGVGAYARADQLSNWFLSSDLDQLATMSGILPTIFLGVAAFLTNMMVARLVAIERSEIGLLKAFGYGNRAIGWHYAKFVIAMAVLGILVGFVVGSWLGRYNTELYGTFYRFPFLLYRPSLNVYAIAALISIAVSLAGAATAVRRAVALPPAEAMQPPAPTSYARGALSDGGLFDQPTRMVLRHAGRWPIRSAMTGVGVAMAVAVLVISMQWMDSIDHIVDVYFHQAQRQDITMSLAEAQASTVLRDVEHLPGVMAAEPVRFVRARLRSGPRTKRVAIQGVLPDARLNLAYDASGRVLPIPPKGLVLSTKLADILGVGRGDIITVEILEGRRRIERTPVVDLFETYIGIPAYMDLAALNRLMRDRPMMSGAQVRIDPAKEAVLFAKLKQTPQVAAVTLRRSLVESFDETMAETIMIFITFFIGFAGTLAFGVAYNSGRIALSEQGRELATLRVLGFSIGEVSYILLGEVLLLIIIGLPLGCLAGYGLAWTIASAFDTELYRVPFFIETATFGTAIVITLAATTASLVIVRRRLQKLDLIAVLKTRE